MNRKNKNRILRNIKNKYRIFIESKRKVYRKDLQRLNMEKMRLEHERQWMNEEWKHSFNKEKVLKNNSYLTKKLRIFTFLTPLLFLFKLSYLPYNSTNLGMFKKYKVYKKR